MQPPPQLHTQNSEELGLDDEEPSLCDVVKMLGDITTGLANTNALVDSLAAHVVTPGATPDAQPRTSRLTAKGGIPLASAVDDPDRFHTMEEEVHLRIPQRLNAAQPVYLPITDDDSTGDPEDHTQPRRQHNSTSGKTII